MERCDEALLEAAACGDDENEEASAGGDSATQLSGTIRIDGSSTVAPLSEAAAELFQQQHPDVRVAVGTSGTGGGFEKFCRGETDISDASRQIDDEEKAACEKAGIQFEELAVANDALTVVVNQDNDFAKCLTVEELAKIWRPKNPVDNWSEVRQGFPDREIERFGPGTDSGTFDYFTDAVNGEEGAQTQQYNNVGEDDNATVTGVSGTEGAIGYFGYSFFAENEGKVKALEIENEQGECVAPSPAAAQDGSYAPLGRQLFIYPSGKALQQDEVEAFLRFYIEQNDQIAERSGLIPLTDEQKQEATQKLESLLAGGASAAEPAETTTTP
ncbi:MAG: PstS family phosphate ABC transporter substrate-binding protein [Actinobacteria bacterium]|nr:PstS family phosphate ABC transporter substrate-binding protein [Actinomycetota bacterium]